MVFSKPDTSFAVKTKILTEKCFTYTNFKEDRKRCIDAYKDTLFGYKNLAIDVQ